VDLVFFFEVDSCRYNDGEVGDDETDAILRKKKVSMRLFVKLLGWNLPQPAQRRGCDSRLSGKGELHGRRRPEIKSRQELKNEWTAKEENKSLTIVVATQVEKIIDNLILRLRLCNL
jgi:hypothetical protein